MSQNNHYKQIFSQYSGYVYQFAESVPEGESPQEYISNQFVTESKKQGIKTIIREVKTKNYEGKVMVYPTSFLENYFNPQPTQPNIFDDLPF
jgi:hypothetical protein